MRKSMRNPGTPHDRTLVVGEPFVNPVSEKRMEDGMGLVEIDPVSDIDI